METTNRHYGHPVGVNLTLGVGGEPKLFCFGYQPGSGVLLPMMCPEGAKPGEPLMHIDMTNDIRKPMSKMPADAREVAPARYRGLGDVVAKVTSALGIKQKPGCGCKRRQEKLNKLVPFKPGGA
jgi:hypothetical protein